MQRKYRADSCACCILLLEQGWCWCRKGLVAISGIGKVLSSWIGMDGTVYKSFQLFFGSFSFDVQTYWLNKNILFPMFFRISGAFVFQKVRRIGEQNLLSVDLFHTNMEFLFPKTFRGGVFTDRFLCFRHGSPPRMTRWKKLNTSWALQGDRTDQQKPLRSDDSRLVSSHIYLFFWKPSWVFKKWEGLKTRTSDRYVLGGFMWVLRCYLWCLTPMEITCFERLFLWFV